MIWLIPFGAVMMFLGANMNLLNSKPIEVHIWFAVVLLMAWISWGYRV